MQQTKGAWYRGWRLVSLDGSTLDVAETAENERAFGRPGASRGASAYPQVRLVALLENGTDVLFGTQCGSYGDSEVRMAEPILVWLRREMLCLADRNFFSFDLWNKAQARGARSVVAGEEESPAALRKAAGRRLLSERPLPLGENYSAAAEFFTKAREV